MVRISVPPTPTPAISQVGEPTWYFLWDAAVNTVIAFGTLAALGVAIWVAGQPARERNRAQASRVTLIPVDVGRPEPSGPRPASLFEGATILFEAHNGSDAPIGNVYLRGQDHRWLFRTVYVMRPGEVSTHDIPLGKAALLGFRDTNGRRWERSTSGVLRRAAPMWITKMAIRRVLRPRFTPRGWLRYWRNNRRNQATGEHRPRYLPPEPPVPVVAVRIAPDNPPLSGVKR